MNDEKRLCGRCHHEHAWGIVGRSEDNVPLYGARPCGEYADGILNQWLCNCADFVPDGGTELMLGLPPEELGKLWQETSFLNAQTPMASRIAIRQVMSLPDGPERNKEFMGLMLSQVMDTRALLSNDENKFAHMVAHVDEIVESMRGVSQLKERLESVNRSIVENGERMDKLEAMIAAISEKLGIGVEPAPAHYGDLAGLARERSRELLQDALAQERMRTINEAASVFTGTNTKMQDEAVVVDGKPAHDHPERELCSACKNADRGPGVWNEEAEFFQSGPGEFRTVKRGPADDDLP